MPQCDLCGKPAEADDEARDMGYTALCLDCYVMICGKDLAKRRGAKEESADASPA